MATLPIRTMILYKQGIGYFTRQGTVTDTTFALVIPRETTNDVLKSLDIAVSRGGPVLSVDYETPEDKTAVLNTLAVKIADRSSFVDLLTSLRGSQVTLQRDSGEPVVGRVVGVETSLDPGTVVLQAANALQVVPLATIHGLTMHDERATQDISFFLDMSQTDQTRTTLTIRLPAGEHDLSVRYLAPSPTWRVSYRLVRDASGDVRLAAWGLFDNALDEDLDHVQLTFISGRPISFEYELYESRIPPRPHVSDDPTSIENAAGSPMFRDSIATLSHELRSPLTAISGFSELLDREAMGPLSDAQHEAIRTIKSNATHLTTMVGELLKLGRLNDTGSRYDFFTYRAGLLGDLKVSASYFMPVTMGNAEPEFLTYPVATPVSVKRGQSALVPILDATVESEMICVYNEAKMANHPLLVWRVRNTTGVALEQGPVTLTDGDRYLGEGLMRFTGVGDHVELPYALEFGILIKREETRAQRQPWQIVFKAPHKRAEVRWAEVTTHRYTLESHIARSTSIQIERRTPPHRDYVDSPPPISTEQDHARWLVAVPGNATEQLTLQEREIQTEQYDIVALKPELLDQFRQATLLSPEHDRALQQLVTLHEQETVSNAGVRDFHTEREQLLSRQEQIRKNLGALGASDREQTVRDRLLDDLEQSEERRRLIDTTLVELDQRLKTIATQREATIETLFAAESI